MVALLFTSTAITLLVLLGFSVEKICETID